jgi:uncharacterized RmlC-like cupin family protein
MIQTGSACVVDVTYALRWKFLMTDPATYQSFMLDHVAGNLGQGMHVAATIHTLMSREGKEARQVWQSVKVALAADANAINPDRTPDFLEKALQIIETDYDDVKWRRGLSGLKYAKVSDAGGKLMRLHPGDRVFEHTHSALEAMVVLEGCLKDGRGHYEAGELVLATPSVRHRPEAAGNAACTCFVAQSDIPFWRFT